MDGLAFLDVEGGVPRRDQEVVLGGWEGGEL